jgi:hypothetical protein
MTYDRLMVLRERVVDERSFVEFLRALRDWCERSEGQDFHWETHATRDYLRSMEDWTGGDFIEGRHGDEPILRRVATLLLVGMHRVRDDPPDDDDR